MTTLPPSVDIPLSKRKNVLMLLGCLLFMVVACYFWAASVESPESSRFKLVALAAFFFFGLVCGSYGLYKLIENRPGLVLSAAGIQDNSSAFGGKLIRWADVVALEERVVQHEPVLLVHVRYPKEIIRKENYILQKAMRLNLELYGTPMVLSADGLKCSFEEMVRLVREYHQLYADQATGRQVEK